MLRKGGRKEQGNNVLPCIFRRGDISFAVQCDMAKCVAIDELHGPINQSDNTLQEAET